MQIPPFARGHPSRMQNVALFTMEFKPFCSVIQGILKRNLGELLFYEDTMLSVLHSFAFIRSLSNADQRIKQYSEGLRLCFELFNLIVDFGKVQGLYDFIRECIPRINDGRAESFLNSKVEVNGKYPETLRRKNLTEYKILYDACVRYSVLPFIWCLDTIDAFELPPKATVGDSASYFERDVKDHVKRLLEPTKPLPSKLCLSPLAQGLDRHWRNAIAHERIEHRVGGALLFDFPPSKPGQPNKPKKLENSRWEQLASDEEITSKIEELQVTLCFQAAACSLFGFEFETKIDWSTHQAWRSEKELANLIAIRVERLNLAMHDSIEFEGKQISVKLKKQGGFDHPSSMFWEGAGGGGWVDLPAFDLERQIFELAQ